MKRRTLSDWSRDRPPACFAPVMATGIVSQAVGQAGAHGAGGALLAVAVATYATLLIATGVKAARHPDRLVAELRDPARLFGHFTLVAASDVLATRLAHGPLRLAADALLTLAALAWIALATAALRMLRPSAREASAQADGTWFLPTVGIQSLVLACTSLRDGPTGTGALGLWACGTALYAATLAAVIHRLRRHPPRPAQLTPTYWVTMGAAAISCLAGSRLLAVRPPLPQPLQWALSTAVTALWLWATLLIPLLLAAGVWRHLRHRLPLIYEPALWCIVFPLGMYATATAHLATSHRATARAAHFLTAAAHPLAWTALAAWLAVHTRLLTTRGDARRLM